MDVDAEEEVELLRLELLLLARFVLLSPKKTSSLLCMHFFLFFFKTTFTNTVSLICNCKRNC